MFNYQIQTQRGRNPYSSQGLCVWEDERTLKFLGRVGIQRLAQPLLLGTEIVEQNSFALHLKLSSDLLDCIYLLLMTRCDLTILGNKSLRSCNGNLPSGSIIMSTHRLGIFPMEVCVLSAAETDLPDLVALEILSVLLFKLTRASKDAS